MRVRYELRRWAIVALVLLATGGVASAARLRFHYGPADGICDPGCHPAATLNVVGERVSLFGSACEGCDNRLPRPGCFHTFRHPCTGQPVTVPLALPEGTPRIEHRFRRIIYNYGSYTVEVAFVPDGTVDVIYNAGPGRCP
jgi:hypothetical protein